MRRIEFVISGSEGDHYTTTFQKNGATLNAFCTCPAGKARKHCKHRFALMEGDISALVSQNVDDVATLKEILIGTDLENAHKAFCSAQSIYAAAKDELESAKKVLAEAMHR